MNLRMTVTAAMAALWHGVQSVSRPLTTSGMTSHLTSSSHALSSTTCTFSSKYVVVCCNVAHAHTHTRTSTLTHWLVTEVLFILHSVAKKIHILILNSSVNNQPILIICGAQNSEAIWVFCPSHLKNVTTVAFEVQKSHFQQQVVFDIRNCNWTNSQSAKFNLFFNRRETVQCGSHMNLQNYRII